LKPDHNDEEIEDLGGLAVENGTGKRPIADRWQSLAGSCPIAPIG
jgi:hypothetical protein